MYQCCYQSAAGVIVSCILHSWHTDPCTQQPHTIAFTLCFCMGSSNSCCHGDSRTIKVVNLARSFSLSINLTVNSPWKKNECRTSSGRQWKLICCRDFDKAVQKSCDPKCRNFHYTSGTCLLSLVSFHKSEIRRLSFASGLTFAYPPLLPPWALPLKPWIEKGLCGNEVRLCKNLLRCYT